MPPHPDESVFRTIADTAISPYLLLDGTGVITWVSSSITEMLGYAPDELIGTNGIDLVHPDHHEIAFRAFTYTEDVATHNANWTSAGLVLDMIAADGSLVPCDVSGATSARTGLDVYVIQLRRAIGTESMRRVVAAMAANETSDDVLTLVAESLASGLVDTHIAVIWEWEAGVFTRQAGSTDHVVPLDALSDGQDSLDGWPTTRLRWDFPDTMPNALLHALPPGVHGAAIEPVTVELFDRPAGVILAWWTSPGRSPLFPGMIEQTARRVTLVLQWSEGRRALEWDASHDALTGLANRRAFIDDLHRSLDGGTVGAVFYLDLDDFKAVNDDHGHLIGDKALEAVGERLRSCARPGDLVARMGGDEFAVFCAGIVDDEAAADRASRFVEALADPIAIGGTSVEIGASVGVAVAVTAQQVEDLLAAADTRLLDAKSSRAPRHGTRSDG